jgi:transcriptional regulator with AAA-type ATPase domain/tetratricopeptide (TPR) repeat protein
MAELDELLGESAAIQSVRDTIRRLLARVQVGRRVPSVLIQGDTGTGKGLAARLIHRLGPRAGGPFVDINCAAIPEALLEAELFGYERGAFTDARHAKPGLFQTAHRGTMFLDEVALLPAALQAKLLKVLEERAVRRLGSTVNEAVDVWIISATNADLQAAIEERRFREDLYHRLAVVTIRLPALRERGRDVLLLAERFLVRACTDYGLAPKTFSPEAQARLLAHSWPGNVRELGNLAERVALLAEENIVSAAVISLPLLHAGAETPVRPPAPAPLDGEMRGQLLGALTQTQWNISQTAALLGISRNTVRARIKRFGLWFGSGAEGNAPQTVADVAQGKPAHAAPEAVPGPTRIGWERRRMTLLRVLLVPQGDVENAPSGSRELETLMDKVRGFGGHIDELSQSSFVAVFGLEPAEDTPQRAAHAALTIGKALERLRVEVGTRFGVKVGIHTSQLLVTPLHGGVEIDAEGRLEALATLEALLKSAAPGAILASSAAKPFLDRRFKLEHLGGGEAAESVYRLVGPEQHGLGPAGQIAAFVGRRQELEVLQSRLALAIAGQGQVINVVGDAGIGKSRLLFEFRRQVAAKEVGYSEGRCASYGGTIPYLPVLEVIRKGFGITDLDGPEIAADKFGSVLDTLHLDREESVPYLMSLLGFKDGTGRLERLSPEAVRARTFDTLTRIVQHATRSRPLIIAVEDLHWIDRASEELLASLVERLPGVPVLLVTTYRPGYRPPWIEKSYATQIALAPLSVEESLTMAQSVSLARPLPDRLIRIILNRAEGNPFFVEELIRAVGDRGELPAGMRVPDTVQGVLMARIERLGEEPRRLLQTASVLGRAASLRVLETMWGDTEVLIALLRELERFEFLYEQRTGEDTLYVFKHALTQEVAYESLLAAKRRTLHAAAGAALELLCAGRLEDVYDRLAYHFAQTDETAKAVEYLTRAADKAMPRHAHMEAIAALETALSRVSKLPLDGQDRLTLELVLRMANSLFFLGRFREILDLLQAQQDRLNRVADPSLTGTFHFQAGLVWNFVGDNERAEAHARKALEASVLSRDEATMGKARYVLALAGVWWGRPQEVIANGSEAVILLERTGEQYWLGMTHCILGLNYALIGQFAEGLAEESKCGEIGCAMESVRLQSYADWATGAIRAFMGEGSAGIESCRRSLARSPDPFNTATALGFLGYAYLQNGQPVDAIGHLEQAIDLFSRFHYRHAQGLFTAYLGEALLLTGDVPRARRLAAEGLELTAGARFPYGTGLVRRLLGRIAKAEGSLAEASQSLADARGLFGSIHARHEVGGTELALAEVAHALGDRDACRAHSGRAHACFRQLGVPRYVERVQHLAAAWGVSLPIEGGSQDP